MKQPYLEGAEITCPDSAWVYDQSGEPISHPREYRHTLSTVINGLVGQGFVIRQVSDSADFSSDPQAAPGTWEHFTAIAPPWLAFWTTYCPE